MLRNLSDLDLKSLRIFCAIVEAGGFTTAQTILNMGLSRLSVAVSDLEVRLGMKLCQRGRQGFQITAEGAAVYEASRVLFSDLGRFLDTVGVLSGKPSAHIAVGFVDGLLSLPGAPTVSALQQFKKTSPATHLTIHIMRPDELEKAVLDEKLTLAVGAFHHRLSGLVYTSIFSEEQSLYCGRHHALAVATGAELLDAISQADYVERGYMLESQKPYQVHLKRAAAAYTMEAILTMLLTGTYIGYLPTHYAKKWVDEGALFRLAPSVFSYSSIFSIVIRQGREIDATTKLMLDSFCNDASTSD